MAPQAPRTSAVTVLIDPHAPSRILLEQLAVVGAAAGLPTVAKDWRGCRLPPTVTVARALPIGWDL